MHRFLIAVSLGAASLLGAVAAPSLADLSPVWAQTQDPGSGGTSVDGYDLERPPSECIGFLPKPDCGKAPEDSGDRGGTMQYVTFGVILAGLAFIFSVVFRKVVQADRAKAQQAYALEVTPGSSSDDPSRTPPSR